MCVRMCVSFSVMSDSDPMGYSPPGSSVHGIFQARILEWVVITYSRGDLPNSGIEPKSLASPALAGVFFTTVSLKKPKCVVLAILTLQKGP